MNLVLHDTIATHTSMNNAGDSCVCCVDREKIATKLTSRKTVNYLKNTLLLKYNPDSKIKADLLRAAKCGDVIQEFELSKDGKIIPHFRRWFCHSKTCNTCNSIRAAFNYNKFKDLVSTWAAPQFVTLTIPHNATHEFEYLLDVLITARNKVTKDAARVKRNGEVVFPDLTAICVLEVTWGKINGFHPHLHLLVPDKETADFVVRRWLHNAKGTTPAAQSIEAVTDIQKCFWELFKYTVKPLNLKPVECELSTAQYQRVLNHIYEVLKGKKLITTWGKARGLPKPKYAAPNAMELQHVDTWAFKHASLEYVNQDGEALSSYNAFQDKKLKHYLSRTHNVTVTSTDNITPPAPLHTSQTAKVEYTTTTTTNAIQGSLSKNTGAHTANNIARHLPYRGVDYVPPPPAPPKINPPKLE